MDDAMQGFEEEAADDGQSEMEEEIEPPTEGTAGRIKQRPGKGSQSADQVAHSQDQGAGSSQLKRQVALAWLQVDEINRLTREKLGLFKVDAFDKHLLGRIILHNAWHSHTCASGRRHEGHQVCVWVPHGEPAMYMHALVQ